MTTDMFMVHVEAMPRLHAQKLLAASTAAIARFQKPEWWQALAEAASGEDDGADAPRRRSPLSINGQAMPIGEAKLMLAGALGSGFADGKALPQTPVPAAVLNAQVPVPNGWAQGAARP